MEGVDFAREVVVELFLLDKPLKRRTDVEYNEVVGEIEEYFEGVVGTKEEKVDTGLNISSSELLDNFSQADSLAAGINGGEMEEDAEKGYSVPESGERLRGIEVWFKGEMVFEGFTQFSLSWWWLMTMKLFVALKIPSSELELLVAAGARTGFVFEK
jgi:hypothetical protein